MTNKIYSLIGLFVVMLCITMFALKPVQAQVDPTIAAADAARIKRQGELAATYQAMIAETRRAQATTAYWARETAIAQANATATAIANAAATGIANVTATAQANATATAQANATSAASATLASQRVTATYEAEQFAERLQRQKERVNVGLRAAVLIGIFVLIAIGLRVYWVMKPPQQKTVYVAATIENKPEPTLKDLTENIPQASKIDVKLDDADTADLWQHLQNEGIRPEG